MQTITLATLNLWNWPFEWRERLERAAAFAAGVDVLCIQEAVEHDGAHTAELLAEWSGLQLVTPLAADGLATACAVLTRLDAADGQLVALVEHPENEQYDRAAVVCVDTAAGPLWVSSVHLAWGSLAEAGRLSQLQRLVGWHDTQLGASETEAAAVIAGDFNTTMGAESIRYLSGLTVHEPATGWVDAWCRPADELDTGVTQDGANPYARYTARQYRTGRDAVVDDTLLPGRRIDYVFSRGWRHGRLFSPVATRVVREPLMSDHYAVVTELLVG